MFWTVTYGGVPLEMRPENSENLKQHPHGRMRIKNITNEVEEHKFDPAVDSILPKTDWETRMAAARASQARMKAASLKEKNGGTRQGMSDNGPMKRQTSGGMAPAGQHTAGSGARPERPAAGSTARQGRSATGGAARPGRHAVGSTARPGRSTGEGVSLQRRYKSGSVAGSQGRPGTRPVSVSQLSREFEDEDRRQNVRPRKKKSSRPAKIIAAVIVLMIIIGSVFLITSYGQGSSSNQKGLKLYADGSYADAVSMFEAALAKDEGNAEYLINLGMAYIALGQYDDALAAFENSISNTSRGDLLELAKRGSGIVYLSSGHYSKAVDLFKEALAYGNGEYTEQEIDILYYLAEAQDRAGDAVGAAESYTKIIEHQEDANAYMLRGIAYQRSADTGRAEMDLKTALDMSKKNYKIYLALYEVLMAQQKTDEAASILDEALNLGGKTGEDYSNRGIVYMYKEDYANAAAAFNTALEKGYSGAYLGLAESLMRQGDFEGAAKQYEAYIAVDTTNAAAYNQYGLCLMELLRYEDARKAFESGLSLNDRLVDKELMYNEAVALEYLGDWTGAYEKMKAFVEKYPDDAQGQHEFTFLESTQQ